MASKADTMRVLLFRLFANTHFFHPQRPAPAKTGLGERAQQAIHNVKHTLQLRQTLNVFFFPFTLVLDLINCFFFHFSSYNVFFSFQLI